MSHVPRNRVVWFVTLAVLGLTCDLYSKHLVFATLGYPNGTGDWVDLFGGAIRFRLHTYFNHGALWGLGQGLTWLFGAMSVVAAVAITYWLFWKGAAQSLWLTVSLAFVMSGTLGNLYDRLAWHGYINLETGEPYHAVRDFLYFRLGTYDWPIFNFADVFLVTGATMLVIYSFLVTEVPETAAAAASPEAPEGAKPSTP